MSRVPPFEEVDDHGQILFCGDPGLQLDGILLGLQTPQGTVTLDPDLTGHTPAALFEFRQVLRLHTNHVQHAVTSAASIEEVPREPQIEGAILFGMQRLPPEFSQLRLPDPPSSDEDGVRLDRIPPTVFEKLRMREPPRRDENEVYFGMRRRPPGYADLRSAPGWELHEIPDCDAGRWRPDVMSRSRLELRTPDGELYSRAWVSPDPAWQAAALEHGYVVCLCGLFLGLIGPIDMTAAAYTPAMRRQGFEIGCALGLTVGGIVTYVNHS
ncbi:hypothetical protein C8250_041055 [Streptomyces sp. So13.3]|uniref:hypothetical protein n=1 Tax=Streptomyces sp. So13.3 TaxID=2136173 RepID=UPI0011068193|nr:hypothetical protein [Streptomyces sp. So13.3]QNA77359.1 hypothetical protein C8250_041055 [Streptomyces sp. So13.3]